MVEAGNTTSFGFESRSGALSTTVSATSQEKLLFGESHSPHPGTKELQSPQSTLMLFQVLSDLHLEVGQQYSSFDVDVRAPYLILGGDIGRLVDYDGLLCFLERQCAKFTQVLMVLGNHEMYGTSRQAGLEAANRLQSEAKLQGRFVLLNRTRVDLSEEVTILGCTLHSHISDASRDVVRMMLQDFTKTENWTVDDHNAAHAEDIAWLRAEIRAIRKLEDSSPRPEPGRKIVVVTHHAPSRSQTSEPKYENNPWSDAFATELLTGSPNTNPLLSCNWWVYGHTHYTNYFEIGGVKLFSNQRGYVFPWQTKDKAIDLSTKPSTTTKLQNGIKRGLTMARLRSPPKYEKQVNHEYDANATIDV